MPSQTRIRIGILGATGFTGRELVSLILRHPGARLEWLSSQSQAGIAYSSLYPRFRGRLPEGTDGLKSEAEAKETAPDLVFSCLPHGASARMVASFLENGRTRVIDLSADFRIRDGDAYSRAYGEHPAPALLEQAVYGLTEVHGREVQGARLVANPGCYPTSALLPLIPLLRDGIISREGIIVDSKSGVSGAGKKATETTHYVNCNESVAAYQIGDQHRHLPEMAEQLSLAAGGPGGLLFTPHLIPMERGILSTIYCDLEKGGDADAALSCLAGFYAGSPFVHLREDMPRTGDVSHTNHCHIRVYRPAGARKLIIVSVLDNMMKGASGQALQNMNLMFGLPAETGLA